MPPRPPKLSRASILRRNAENPASQRQTTAASVPKGQLIRLFSAEDIARLNQLLSEDTPHQQRFMEAWMKLVIECRLVTHYSKNQHRKKLAAHFEKDFGDRLKTYLLASNVRLHDNEKKIITGEFLKECLSEGGQVEQGIFVQDIMRELTLKRAKSWLTSMSCRDPWAEGKESIDRILAVNPMAKTAHDEMKQHNDAYYSDFSSVCWSFASSGANWDIGGIPVLYSLFLPVIAFISRVFSWKMYASQFLMYGAFMLNQIPLDDEKQYITSRYVIVSIAGAGITLSHSFLSLFLILAKFLFPFAQVSEDLSLSPNSLIGALYWIYFAVTAQFLVVLLLGDFKYLKQSVFSAKSLPQKFYDDLSLSWRTAVSSLQDRLLEDLPQPKREPKDNKSTENKSTAGYPYPLRAPAAGIPVIPTDDKVDDEPRTKLKTQGAQSLLSLVTSCMRSPTQFVTHWQIETQGSPQTVTYSENKLYITKTPHIVRIIALWRWAKSKEDSYEPEERRHFLLLDYQQLQREFGGHFEALLKVAAEGHRVPRDEQPGCRVGVVNKEEEKGVYVKAQAKGHNMSRAFFPLLSKNDEGRFLYGNPRLLLK